MRDLNTWNKISKHISGEETPEEKIIFIDWLSENERNRDLFNQINTSWNESYAEEKSSGFLKKFTRKKMRTHIVNQALGNFISFVVGVSVTHLFSNYIVEKKSINNLFGLVKRRQIEVDIIPNWAQWILSVLAGFIVLEFINHIIQNRKHTLIFKYITKYFK